MLAKQPISAKATSRNVIKTSNIVPMYMMIEWLTVLLWTTYAVVCPWTKVEESFNVQAVYDLIFHGTNISQYDHLVFPGVVPRTFFGPLILSLIGKPVFLVLEWAQLQKTWGLLAARFILGLGVFAGFKSFLEAVKFEFGANVALWLFLINATQFHLNFYATRPLPNVFALCIMLFVYAAILKSQHRSAVWLATFSVFIYRTELLLLYAPIFLPLIWRRKLGLTTAITHGIFALIASLAITVPLDSYLWRRFLWPEGEVWWYNIILNKSHNWGTQPILWYFYSALPRALGSSLTLIPLGLVFEPRIRHLVTSSVIFVGFYSLLPHKELRFIFYVIPALNLAAAAFCSRVWHNRKKSILWKFGLIICIGQLIVNLGLTAVFLSAAKWNYPGGDGLSRLHQIAEGRKEENLHIHIDVFCAQTGISRFLHKNQAWEYNKSESIKPNSPYMKSFDFALAGTEENLENEILKYSKNGFKVAERFPRFRRIRLKIIGKFPFIDFGFELSDTVALLENFNK